MREVCLTSHTALLVGCWRNAVNPAVWRLLNREDCHLLQMAWQNHYSLRLWQRCQQLTSMAVSQELIIIWLIAGGLMVRRPLNSRDPGVVEIEFWMWCRIICSNKSRYNLHVADSCLRVRRQYGISSSKRSPDCGRQWWLMMYGEKYGWCSFMPFLVWCTFSRMVGGLGSSFG